MQVLVKCLHSIIFNQPAPINRLNIHVIVRRKFQLPGNSWLPINPNHLVSFIAELEFHKSFSDSLSGTECIEMEDITIVRCAVIGAS